MAHMDRMIILHCYGECVWSEIESARAKIFTNMLPGSQWTLCVNGVKRWFPRSYAAGE